MRFLVRQNHVLFINCTYILLYDHWNISRVLIKCISEHYVHVNGSKTVHKLPSDNPHDALYRFSMYGMMWGAPSVVCQPTTVQLMTVLAAPHHPPPPLSVRSRGNGITEQRLCWQSLRQHQAQGRPLTSHPPPTSPETWKHRKKARSSRWECLSTRRGNWNWVRSDGEGKE